MLEKDIEAAFVKVCKEKGCTSYKFTSPGHRGVPDRLVVGPKGLHFFIEFKAPGKEPTPMQQREMDRLKDLGQHVFWTDSLEKAIWALDYMIRGTHDIQTP